MTKFPGCLLLMVAVVCPIFDVSAAADVNGNVNCRNCTNCKSCTNCQNCHNCTSCTDSKDLRNCSSCTNCTYLTNCSSCTNVNHCNGIKSITNRNCLVRDSGSFSGNGGGIYNEGISNGNGDGYHAGGTQGHQNVPGDNYNNQYGRKRRNVQLKSS